MALNKSTWAIAALASVVSATAAVGISYLVTQQAIKTELPGAIAAHLASEEEARIAARRAEILAPWAGAADLNEPGKHIYGSLNADFTLVEFSDLECGFCKRFHETPKKLVEQAGGKINWEWQHYPLGFHNPAAEKAAHAAECIAEDAGNQAFWAFTGEWFARSAMNGQGYDDIELLAREIGAKPDAFRECMASGRYKDLVKAQMDKGTAMGVTGTPATVVVDNTTGRQILVKGAQQPQALLQAISQLIEQRSQPAMSPIQEEQADG